MTFPRRWIAVVGVVAAITAVTVLVLVTGSNGDRAVAVRTGAGPTAAAPASPASRTSAEPSDYWRTDGSEPPLHPETQLGVGFFADGDPLARVVEALGPSAEQRVEEQELVLGDTIVSRWEVAAAASLVLEALPDGPNQIELINLSVSPGSPARVALWPDLVAGRSTLREAIAAWGEGHSKQVSPAAEGSVDEPVGAYLHQVAWPACDGASPMLVVLSRRVAAPHDATIGDPPPPFDPALLDQPITDVLVTWADAEPHTSGC